MPYEALRIEVANPRIGAFVPGVDIVAPLNNREVRELYQALAEYHVLFFYDQTFALDTQKVFGRLFGEMHIHPNTPAPEGHPEVRPIHAGASSKGFTSPTCRK
jgi:taurine dioxygenase